MTDIPETEEDLNVLMNEFQVFWCREQSQNNFGGKTLDCDELITGTILEENEVTPHLLQASEFLQNFIIKPFDWKMGVLVKILKVGDLTEYGDYIVEFTDIGWNENIHP